MANEAATTIVMRMRDEASSQMQNFGQTTQEAQIEALQLNTALTAMESAFTAVGSLVNQLDSPLAKTAGTFITTAGAIMATASAIMTMLPYIQQLITQLKTLALTQVILKAFSGPAGWIGLGIGAGALTGLAIASATGGGGTQTTVNNYNVQGSVVTEKRLAEMTRKEIIKGQERNSTSGIR